MPLTHRFCQQILFRTHYPYYEYITLRRRKVIWRYQYQHFINNACAIQDEASFVGYEIGYVIQMNIVHWINT